MRMTLPHLKRIINEVIAEVQPTPADKPWETIAHHVTLNMGGWKGDPSMLRQYFDLTATGFAMDDKVIAVAVTLPPGVESKNANPHITVAVDREAGGKPAMSNKLDWSKTQAFSLSLRGQLQDTGSYTGIVLTDTDHASLVNAINGLGLSLKTNPSQTPGFAPPESETSSSKQESRKLSAALIREMVRKELRAAFA
jgi:hypothetical protein